MSKRIRIGIVTAIAGAVAVIGAVPASAAWGTTGPYQPAEAGCVSGQIVVSPPAMRAQPVNHGGNVIILGPSHTQWVAHRAWVYHVESRQWVAGPWKLRQTTDDGWASLMSDSWYDSSARSWQSGATTFTIHSSGTYWVYAEYYWFADQYVAAGGDGGFLGVHDYNSGRLAMTNVCRF